MTIAEVPPGEVAARLSGMWTLLSDGERAAFASSFAAYAYRKSEIIYREGEVPDSLLCLLSGRVKIYRDGVGGRSQIMRLLEPGQYFGYRASLAGEPYVTMAAAFEHSVVGLIPMPVVKEAMRTNNALCGFFIRELAVDLGISDSRIVGLTQKHIRGRLADSLLFLKRTYGFEDDGRTLPIHLSREDLAALSNMTTSNAIRTLSCFASEGIIEVKGRRIALLDEPLLARISQMG